MWKWWNKCGSCWLCMRAPASRPILFQFSTECAIRVHTTRRPISRRTMNRHSALRRERFYAYIKIVSWWFKFYGQFVICVRIGDLWYRLIIISLKWMFALMRDTHTRRHSCDSDRVTAHRTRSRRGNKKRIFYYYNPHLKLHKRFISSGTILSTTELTMYFAQNADRRSFASQNDIESEKFANKIRPTPNTRQWNKRNKK